MKNCTPLWREAHFQVKMYKTPQVRSTFGSCDVEKDRKSARRCGATEVAMSKKCTPLWREAHLQVKKLKNVKNTSRSEHFWKLRCRKKCTPLWREAHVEVKSAKTRGFGALFDVQMPFRVAGARDCQK